MLLRLAAWRVGMADALRGADPSSLLVFTIGTFKSILFSSELFDYKIALALSLEDSDNASGGDPVGPCSNPLYILQLLFE